MSVTTIILAALIAGAAADNPSRQELIDKIMRPVVLKHPDTAAIQVTRDIPYSEDDPLQKLDIYHPLKVGPAPAVILVHGWADINFRPKDWGVFQSWGRLFAAHGMAAVIYNHRLGAAGEGRPQAQRDLHAVANFIQQHAARYSLNRERVAVMIFSGGGDLLPDAYAVSPQVNAVVAYFPLLTRVSPAVASGPRVPPTLIVRAGRDQMPGLLYALDRYVAAAKATEPNLHVINHAEGGHGFENDPDDKGAPKVIRRTLQFLQRSLRR